MPYRLPRDQGETKSCRNYHFVRPSQVNGLMRGYQE